MLENIKRDWKRNLKWSLFKERHPQFTTVHSTYFTDHQGQRELGENVVWKAVKLECTLAYWGNSTRRTSHSFQFLRVPLWIEMPVFKWKVFSDHLEIFTISLFTNYSVLHFLGERETKLWASFCFLKFLKFNEPSISILSTFLCYVTYQRSYVI